MRTLEDIQKGPLRLYSFVNYYLSDLQRGLQTAHLVAELFVDYASEPIGSATDSILKGWGENDKTIIILNGGNCSDLINIFCRLQTKAGDYPCNVFQEDEASLGRATTCAGIIFPEFTKQDVEDYADVADGTDDFIDLMRLIRSCPLA